MNQETKRSADLAGEGAIARLGAALADWSEKWFPDAYVFGAIAVVIVCAAALAMDRTPSEISVDFGKSFWNLIPFTMQMAFVVFGGYVVVVSAPVRKVIEALARFPKTPKVAVAYVLQLHLRCMNDSVGELPIGRFHRIQWPLRSTPCGSLGLYPVIRPLAMSGGSTPDT